MSARPSVADGDPTGRKHADLVGFGPAPGRLVVGGNIPAIETNIRGIISQTALKGAEPAKETLEALAAYVKSLPNGPAPFLKTDGMPRDTAPADVKRGFALVLGKAGCMTAFAVAYDKKGRKDVGSAARSGARRCATCRRPRPISMTAASRLSTRP
jgi:hypothetical protein